MGAIDDFYKDQDSHSKYFKHYGLVLDLTMGESLGLKTGDEWKRMRRIFSKFYSLVSLQRNINVIENVVLKFISNLPSIPTSLEDMKLELLPLQVLSHISYGVLSETRMEYLVELYQRHKVITDLMNSSIILKLPILCYLPFKSNRILKSFVNDWESFNKKLYQEAFSREDENDLLSQVIKDIKESNENLTWLELVHTIYEVLLFNVEITYLSISQTLLSIATFPQIQQIAYEEVLQKDLEKDTIPDLPYLEAIMLETSRLNPSITLTFPEGTNKVTTIGDFLIPSGVQVCIDAFSLNNDRDYWENPTEFKPERWINQKHKNYHRFGMGPRKCIGFRYANRIILSVLSNIIKKYHITAEDKVLELKTKGLPFISPYSPKAVLLFSPR